MKLGIMQPYFMPYIGYFQLIAAVDVFVVYDNIKYTKKGWINRNRMLLNGGDTMFTIPVKKDSDALDVVGRQLAADFNRNKLLSQFKGTYSKAPHFAETFGLLERVINCEYDNLFEYIHHSLIEICCHLEINTEIRISSDIPIDHDLRGQDKVLALCQTLGAHTYINTIGGSELYDQEEFSTLGTTLKFIKAKPISYQQLGSAFVPWLSIVDVMMFNSIDLTKEYLARFELVTGASKNV